MAGPYPPYPPAGAEGQPLPYPGAYPNPYPGALPPPVGYSQQPASGKRPLWWALAGLAAVAALVGVLLAFGVGRSGGAGMLTDSAAKSSIQTYLTALSDRDTETIARNTTCGMFDAIKDRKSDLALARLASDAFRKQFTSAEVTSIDEIVLSSSYQAQVLFTMKVAPAEGARNARDEQQGVAQLLRQDDTLLVCSYLLRTAAQF